MNVGKLRAVLKESKKQKATEQQRSKLNSTDFSCYFIQNTQ